MRVCLFQSMAVADLYAYSADRRGARLPEAHAPWRAFAAGNSFQFDWLDDVVISALSRDGYYLLADVESV
jgi:hypothetical protein